jgi:hypothetical protein
MRNPDPQHHLPKNVDHTMRSIKPLLGYVNHIKERNIQSCVKGFGATAKCRPFLQQTGSGQQLTGSSVLRLAGEVENLVQFHPGDKKNILASILICLKQKKEQPTERKTGTNVAYLIQCASAMCGVCV